MMRRLGLVLFALLLATGAQAQTGSNKTQAQLNTEIGTTGCSQPTCLWPDNTTGLITPFDLRQVVLDVVATQFATFPTLAGNNVWTGVNNYTGTFQIGGNTITFPTIAAGLTYKSGTFTPGDCLQIAPGTPGTLGALVDFGAPCGSGGGGGAVNSVFGRTGNVTALTGDYTAAQITGLGTLATQNAATPPALGTTTPNTAVFTTLTANTLFNFISTFQANGNTIGFPSTAATLAFQTGSFTPGDCIKVAASGAGGTVGGLADAGAACGSGGGGGGSSTANSQTFVAGVNFTPGTTTSLTLSSPPIAAAALYIYEDGVSQPSNGTNTAPSQWSVNLTTGVVTFTNPIQAQSTVYATWLSTSISSGTVTSVGLSDGSTAPIFAISSSPVTTSGTLTETLRTQTANLVFAGPTSGGAAQPTFRALAAADIPTTITWPTTADIVLSNGTISPAGLAPVNGDCVVGSGGAWTAGSCGSPTFPTSGDIVVANGTNSPAGLAPVNGDCVIGSGGAWVAGSCGGVTWPATGDLLLSAGVSSNPSGLAPVNGDCVIGSGGAWTAGACAGGAAVSSVTGTSGQIAASPTTGSVVLSLPSTITEAITFNGGIIIATNPFTVSGGLIASRRTVTSGSSDTVLATDYLIAIDKTSGSATAESLFACASGIDGTIYVIKDEKGDAATNNITITPVSGTIEGASTAVINSNGASITIQCDGSKTNWVVE
jgi:hypothetical protein